MMKDEYFKLMHDPDFYYHLKNAEHRYRKAKKLLKKKWRWNEAEREEFEHLLGITFPLNTTDLVVALQLLEDGEDEKEVIELLGITEKVGRLLLSLLKDRIEGLSGIEFFAYETFKASEECFTNRFRELLSLEIYDIHKLPEYWKMVKNLEAHERERLKIFLEERMNSYMLRALFAKQSRMIIVDGSNIVHAADGSINMLLLEEAFDELASMPRFFFPPRIVFDANIEYVVTREPDVSILKKWLLSPWVKLHSPADEIIVEMAKRFNASILSRDKFRDYDVEGLEILKPFSRGFSNM